jgi:hypothetical protein
MTPEDIAWVQGRLRGCKYLVSTLHKCAQCLGVGDDELLIALGYESEAALRQAYPDKLRGPGGEHPKPSHYQPPDAETMHEAVLLFYGGTDMDVVKRLMGYAGKISNAAITLRCTSWKEKNPTAACRLPHRRATLAQIRKKGEIKMNVDKKGLPAYCYAIAPKTGLPVRIFRGEHAMFGVRPDMMVSKANAQIGVNARQAAAMAGGVLYGWDGPHADPAQYDDDGVYIGPQ